MGPSLIQFLRSEPTQQVVIGRGQTILATAAFRLAVAGACIISVVAAVYKSCSLPSTVHISPLIPTAARASGARRELTVILMI